MSGNDTQTASEPVAMQVGMRYIVTRASEHGEFQIGDRVQMLAEGAILNQQGAAWMAAEDVPMATRGWAIEPDAEWAKARRAALDRKRAEIRRFMKQG